VTYDHPLFGEMERAALAVRFSGTPGRVAPPCRRGQHNRAILAEIGYGSDEVDQLEASGVVIPPD